MRIGIVNDMVMAVELLKRIVNSVPGYELAWVAYDGAEAVRRCTADTPDLILMDLIMPVMDGVEATYRIMQSTPCAILIVTASVMGNISKVFDAMGHGALDVVKTPTLGADMESESTRELLDKIVTIHRLVGKASCIPPPSAKEPDEDIRLPEPRLVVIGASTGGPLALVQILSQFPRDLPAAVVVIQHVDQHFTEGFVRWLSERCSLPVCIAKEGQLPQAGTVYIADTKNHLILGSGRHMLYTSYPDDSVYVPSVDVFFQSVGEHWPNRGVGVLLTGMGKDGAKGLLALSERGWHTIAQHEDSCVVYGMPKAAVELDAANEVLPLDQIAQAILTALPYSHSKVGA